jgi:cyclopropane fatty-acyl-phospholipid synthase-like methyltransferase
VRTYDRGVAAVPERIRWAVETLAVQPGDRVLEIGCSSGVAASLVCERLDDGRVLAIDRSAIQIERARRRNEAHVAAGRLALETVDIVDFDTGDRRFDKVFAINVNVFWIGSATEELARVRRALAPAGRLFLFYEPPGPARAREVVERLGDVLRAQGFAEPQTLAPAPTRLCCISAPLA